jgi:hybrid cluster-associated redox disulfide protein
MIDKKMLLTEVIAKYPKAAEKLVFKYGMHCVGCSGAAGETIEAGARAHGMKKREIEAMIADLNQHLGKKQAKH